VIVHGAAPVPQTPTAAPDAMSIALAWTQSGTGNPAVTNYTLQRSTTPDFASGVTVLADAKSLTPLTAKAFNDTGLGFLTTYEAGDRVRGGLVHGHAGPTGTLPVTKYLLNHGIGTGTVNTVTVPAAGGATSFTVTGLPSRTTYAVSVVAVNDVGSSPSSATRTVSTR